MPGRGLLDGVPEELDELDELEDVEGTVVEDELLVLVLLDEEEVDELVLLLLLLEEDDVDELLLLGGEDELLLVDVIGEIISLLMVLLPVLVVLLGKIESGPVELVREVEAPEEVVERAGISAVLDRVVSEIPVVESAKGCVVDAVELSTLSKLLDVLVVVSMPDVSKALVPDGVEELSDITPENAVELDVSLTEELEEILDCRIIPEAPELTTFVDEEIFELLRVAGGVEYVGKINDGDELANAELKLAENCDDETG